MIRGRIKVNKTMMELVFRPTKLGGEWGHCHPYLSASRTRDTHVAPEAMDAHNAGSRGDHLSRPYPHCTQGQGEVPDDADNNAAKSGGTLRPDRAREYAAAPGTNDGTTQLGG